MKRLPLKEDNGEFTANDRMVMGDILSHLEENGYGGWVIFLKGLAKKAGLTE